MKKVVLLIALLALMAVGVGAAQAAPLGASIGTAWLNGDGTVDAITGMVRCDAGDKFVLRVNIRNSAGSTAIGRASGTCTGSPQGWTTGAIETTGTFSCGQPVAGHMQVGAGGVKKSFSDKGQTGCVI